MATITLKGNPFETSGNLPTVGSTLPDAQLVGADLSEVSLSSFRGNKVVLSLFPSIDTPTCSASVKNFNKKVSELGGAKVLCISADLPFAQKRFCGAEEIEDVVTLSSFRNPDFATTFGVAVTAGPLQGLLARAVIVADEQGKVVHSQLVKEIADEPDYEAAIQALKKA